MVLFEVSVEVLALKVKLVELVMFQFPVIVTVLAPRVSVLVLLLVLASDDMLTATPLVLSEPAVRVILPVVVRASWRVHSPPDPLKVKEDARLTPFNVMVLPLVVALNVMVPVYVLVISAEPAERFMLPEIAKADEPAQVTLLPPPGAPIVKSRQVAETFTVTV